MRFVKYMKHCMNFLIYHKTYKRHYHSSKFVKKILKDIYGIEIRRKIFGKRHD